MVQMNWFAGQKLRTDVEKKCMDTKSGGGGGVVSDGPYSRLSRGPDWDPVPWLQNGPS